MAIVALFQRARWMLGSWNARSYHLRLNPCQSVTERFVPLKLNTTTTTIGRYRNRYTRAACERNATSTRSPIRRRDRRRAAGTVPDAATLEALTGC